MRGLWGMAWCAAVGCATGSPPDAVEVDVSPPVSVSEAGEEVLRNLGEAAAAHKARRLGAAANHWRVAHATWEAHLEPLADGRHPAEVLAIEYGFGRLRSELERRGGQTTSAHQDLEARIEQILAIIPTEAPEPSAQSGSGSH